ncbi:MnmC family methyltransferase [Nannocystis bainbridge]|uniref:MnmC family methyltransferase n=1 Tax=Nannocystis bainbridge TaxID=2995303 RepID=A0ABT5EAH2_9BACT|nr:MnmC family methyltransferase [Nannocystis bainbridge]MDC0722860.1 MnmC family methyltransferase [Nannocystis bainbridge]
MSDDCEVVTTTGGARAILDRRVGEVMHPVVGPAVEATRLYCEPARLAARLRGQAPLVLLDVGLGAGSNAIAAWRLSEARDRGERLTIVSYERSLDALTLALRPEHAASFDLDGPAGVAAHALLGAGHHDTALTSWRLVVGELPASLAEGPAADVVFWDPFSPRANPELWSVAAFTALRRRCRPGATVHTYSGATAVRSALLLAGFFVGVGEPTGDHKAATCASVDATDLERPLDPRWLARLARSTAAFPADAPADAYARVASHPQFA